jgi:hypothetical protein
VRNGLEDIWVHDQQESRNSFKAKDIVKQLQDGETDLASVAKKNKLKIQSREAIKRNGDIDGALTASAVKSFFETFEGGFIMAPVRNGFIVGKVTDVKIPDVNEITEKELAPITQKAVSLAQNEFINIYLGHLQTQYGVTVNDRLLMSMYGPGNEQF